PPIELDPAPGGHEPRDGVDERRLARAVRPDQPDELARFDAQIDIDDGADAAEADGDAGRLQDRAHRLPPLSRRRVTSAPAPGGAPPSARRRLFLSSFRLYPVPAIPSGFAIRVTIRATPPTSSA